MIIEDEIIAAQHLESMLKELNPGIRVLAVLDSIEASIQYLSEQPAPQLIFLDIELGDGQSFEIFKKINVESPIIFTTAYQEYALRAFKLNSLDYLLKPVDSGELSAALEKYSKLHPGTNQISSSKLFMAIESFERSKKRFLTKNGSRLSSVSADMIAYFFTRDRLQYIKTFSNETLLIDKRLDEIEAELDCTSFFRANRQFILNYNSIEKISTWPSGKLKVKVQPESYEEIIVSRLRAAAFKKWLGE
ncbi:LytTR family DNA-binding domain-containing protein [Flavihumibacter rivuli]|uniref:LytR/AlgR family response regulator transcription factor n=1 Tax=Flavihumibacter rivuli TaxID=2838156 RepID=UPI001EFAF0F9|nr:LytTR family DNA-binding domain-containing protein [Flavihumibacter rivuli]ULQ55256.1 LytTR family DNA-binding domain-containing protein [Flavihumibacter rivuli]